MTTISSSSQDTVLPHEPPVSHPSTYWIPLDDLTYRWGLFGAYDAMNPYASAAVGHAFAALSQERQALRHATAAQQQGVSPQGARPWSQGSLDREACLDTLWQATRSWQQAALSLMLYADTLAHRPQSLVLVETILQETVAQRARLGHLIAEVLEEQAACYGSEHAQLEARTR